MIGHVSQVKNGSIIVEGIVGPGVRKVEFVITAKTVLENVSNVYTLVSTEKTGEHFKSTIQKTPGKISELTPNVNILTIKSSENLLSTDKATAILIEYDTHVLSPR